jgi:hypothetical protein
MASIALSHSLIDGTRAFWDEADTVAADNPH